MYGSVRLFRMRPSRAPASHSSTSWPSVRVVGARRRWSLTAFMASVRQPFAAASVGNDLRILWSRREYTNASYSGSQLQRLPVRLAHARP